MGTPRTNDLLGSALRGRMGREAGGRRENICAEDLSGNRPLFAPMVKLESTDCITELVSP